ncbi:MAG: Mth938-like domain-containing protein [Nitrosomonas sp.]|nr:Mth938-like domain-containing protein [Nitrosomonas sp.]
MKLHLADFAEKKVFTGYGDDHVIINKTRYDKNIIVLPDHIIDNWQVKSITQLTCNDFECVLPFKPEIILLGTGDQLYFPDRTIMVHMIKLGIGIEVMDTKATCRTYNILAEEGRRVAAAILINN